MNDNVYHEIFFYFHLENPNTSVTTLRRIANFETKIFQSYGAIVVTKLQAIFQDAI